MSAVMVMAQLSSFYISFSLKKERSKIKKSRKWNVIYFNMYVHENIYKYMHVFTYVEGFSTVFFFSFYF